MALGKVDIFNRAVGAIGHAMNIGSEKENSKEAKYCDRFYTPLVRQLFEAAYWDFCRDERKLTLVVERDFNVEWQNGDPPRKYRYTHSLPSNCLRPRFLDDYAQFELGTRNGQRVLFSNTENPILVYSFDNTDNSMWSSSFEQAVVSGLAAKIAMPLVGSRTLANQLLEAANAEITQANLVAANQEINIYETIPSAIAARGGYTGPRIVNQYMYPVGPMLSLG